MDHFTSCGEFWADDSSAKLCWGRNSSVDKDDNSFDMTASLQDIQLRCDVMEKQMTASAEAFAKTEVAVKKLSQSLADAVRVSVDKKVLSLSQDFDNGINAMQDQVNTLRDNLVSNTADLGSLIADKAVQLNGSVQLLIQRFAGLFESAFSPLQERVEHIEFWTKMERFYAASELRQWNVIEISSANAEHNYLSANAKPYI